MAPLPMTSQLAHPLPPPLDASRRSLGEASTQASPCLQGQGGGSLWVQGTRPRVAHPAPTLALRTSPFLRGPAPLHCRTRPFAQQQQQHSSPPPAWEAEAPLAAESASAATGAEEAAGEAAGAAEEAARAPSLASLAQHSQPSPLRPPPAPRAWGSSPSSSGVGMWWESVGRQLALAVCLGAGVVGLALAVPSHAAARAKAESKGGKPGAVAVQATDKEGASLRNASAAASLLEGLGVSTTSTMGAEGTSSGKQGASSGAAAGRKAGGAEQEAMERQAAAVEMLETFLKTHPDDIEALKMLLRVRLKAAQFPQGLQVLHSLMRLQPTEREWKYLHAQLLEYGGDLPAARKGFQDLLTLEPLSARALQGLASVMRRSGEDSLVLGMVEEAVKKASTESKPTELTNLKLLLAQMHALQGNVGAALGVYDEILEDNPKDFRPYLCKGLVLSLAGEGEEADKLFKEFRQRCPKAYAPYLDNVIVKSSLEAQRQQIHEKAVKAQGTTRPAVPMTQPGNADFGK